jgi:hypothetical protein
LLAVVLLQIPYFVADKVSKTTSRNAAFADKDDDDEQPNGRNGNGHGEKNIG